MLPNKPTRQRNQNNSTIQPVIAVDQESESEVESIIDKIARKTMDRPNKLKLMMSIPKKKKYMRHAYGSVGTGDVPLHESNYYLKNIDENIYT